MPASIVSSSVSPVEVTAEVFSGRIGSPLDPALSLFGVDAAGKLELIQTDDNTFDNSQATNFFVPLYTDARLYAEAGVPVVLYGAGPRSIEDSNAKRADEHLVLEDLRRATKVVARTLHDLLA